MKYNNKMNIVISQKKRARMMRFVALVLFCLLLTGVYVFVVTTTQKKYEHIKTVQEELMLQIQLERRARDTAGVLTGLADERSNIQTYFKSPDEIISIIEEIEGFESVVGIPVTVVQIHVENEDVESREGILVISVFAEGKWKSITHLLSMLDSLPYQSSFSQVTLDTSGTGGERGDPVWSLRGTLRITLKQTP